MRYLLVVILSILIISCTPKEGTVELITSTAPQLNSKAVQDSIIKEHLENGAWTKGLYSKEWQEEIDKGLAKDSTIAYLWQQKAMPLFKQGKYELGMKAIDKAVQYKPEAHQDYRAFIKCIFAKTYEDAIKDFEDCKRKFGNNYIQDHSYDFYIAISKIQLNRYEEAEIILERAIEEQRKNRGEALVHHLDLFYLGISKYEQGKYEEAIKDFDKALKLYSRFAEVLYYKANCEGRLGNKELAAKLTEEAKAYGKQGYTINEDNAIYERYPYQVRWALWD